MNESENQIQELENAFPALSGIAFAAARRQALTAGQSIVESRNGVLYRVSPDGHEVVIKKIAPPKTVERGRKIKFG
jgi:hypothetical protein